MPEFDRREFLKLVGASAGGAAAAGCSDPVEKLIPYVVQPEEITPGLPVFYASTCQECPAGCGLHVRTREGRPVKLEGNPDHPVNRGALCARGQAAIGRTYHPDRIQGPMLRGADGRLEPVSWEQATAALAEAIRKAPAQLGVLGGATGPTLSALIDQWVEAVGGGRRVVYEPFAYEALAEASRAVFGVAGRPVFDLSGADFVIDFGADAMESWLSPTEHARQIEQARDVTEHPDGGARLVYVGPRLSGTAGNSDEWIPAKPGTEGILALAIARAAFDRARAQGKGVGGDPALIQRVLSGFAPEAVASRTEVPAETIRRLGAEMVARARPVALPPGVALTSRRAVVTAAAVLLLNAVVGAVGQTVQLASGTPSAGEPASFREVMRLIDAMKSGDLRVLLIHGSNPVYSLPPDAGFAEALDEVAFVVSFASAPDETSARAHLILPDHTSLESWGDAAPRPGIRGLVQPTIRPLYDTQALGDTLLQTARALGDAVAAKLPSGSFRNVLESAWSDTDFRSALARGGLFGAMPPTAAQVSPGVAKLEFKEPQFEGDGAFLVLPYPSPLLSDGRGASLAWLQETPDPVTQISWQSWVELSQKTADALGVEPGDVVSVETTFGRIEAPVLPRGGLRDDVVAVAIGQGHSVGLFASRDGAPRGVNAVSVLPALTDEAGGRAWLTARAEVAKTDRFERLARAQASDNQRGRGFAQAISLAALAAGDAGAEGHGAGGNGHGGLGESHEILRPFDPAGDAVSDSLYRWGMAIDLDRCTGCSACVVACGIENNIPTVGEQGVLRKRTMQWIRIERYVGDGEPTLETGRQPYRDHERLGKLDVRHLPMLCQQCGAAPCEPVCPVLATYHNPEGLNGMIYNRCIGTRYCSNNCPYKVRRFNWFDYGIENWPEPMGLGLNPDVTVRGQGVMEKCTFCIQRIQAARQTAKDEGRPIADGEVVPACAQTCPTRAITFGNLRDPESRASRQAAGAESRSYRVLHMLNTRPSISYLAKVDRGPRSEASAQHAGEAGDRAAVARTDARRGDAEAGGSHG
jgi:anaerobic selenocysteine-containing dehydrogenase/Fe-S-cluster-containing dehydrogenase component